MQDLESFREQGHCHGIYRLYQRSKKGDTFGPREGDIRCVPSDLQSPRGQMTARKSLWRMGMLLMMRTRSRPLTYDSAGEPSETPDATHSSVQQRRRLPDGDEHLPITAKGNMGQGHSIRRSHQRQLNQRSLHNYQDAVNHPLYGKEWELAIQEEYESLMENGTQHRHLRMGLQGECGWEDCEIQWQACGAWIHSGLRHRLSRNLRAGRKVNDISCHLRTRSP